MSTAADIEPSGGESVSVERAVLIEAVRAAREFAQEYGGDTVTEQDAASWNFLLGYLHLEAVADEGDRR